MTKRRHPPRGRLALVAIALAAIVVCFGGLTGSAPGQSLTKVTVNTLPIANGPAAHPRHPARASSRPRGSRCKPTILQSGNDIVLAMANSKGDIGYIGYVPAMIGRTQGIPITVIAASETEGTSEADNWQNIMVKGSKSIRTPADLVGKTVALNALKGVGEVAVRAALDKVGVDQNSVKYLALPFPTMRTALANGQVDAVWTPEPFMSQILSDGGRIVMAPGPVLGRYFPNGGYAARERLGEEESGPRRQVRAAINQSLVYATHPDEIRALLPAANRNIRLANWSPLIDRVQLLKLAKYAKQYGAISTLPNFTQLFPSYIEGGKTLQATVGAGSFLTLRLDGKSISALKAGKYNINVTDKSTKDNFHLQVPGVEKSTSVSKKEEVTWTLNLKKGVYGYSSDGSSKRKGSFRVT